MKKTQNKSKGYVDLGFAKVDTDRERRQGFPEVIFGEGKTPAQIARIAHEIVKMSGRALVTRATPDAFSALQKTMPEAVYHEEARLIMVGGFPPPAQRIDRCALCGNLRFARGRGGGADCRGHGQSCGETLRHRRGGHSSAARPSALDSQSAGGHRGRGHGWGVAERGRGPDFPAFDRCSHQCRLWSILQRGRRTFDDAEFLWQRGDGGEYRQWIRRGGGRQPD
ncbi:hypothetical protein QPK87_27170 [Kamptonema cortianum]|nr:hypothetical protein [Kamptonema cortianum]